MPNQAPLTGMIIGCCFRVANETGPGLLDLGRAKIQVRRLIMSRRAETGDVDLDVDEVQ